MSGWPYLLLFPSALLALDDFRTRRIGSVWLVLLAVMACAGCCASQGGGTALWRIGINSAVLLLLGGFIWCWSLLRGRSVTEYVGSGDILFLLAVSPVFSAACYVWFLLLSCVLALALWAVLRWKTIPFVGVMAVVLAAAVVCNTFGLWT